MKFNPQTHFTSREFSKLCGVSKHTLFHYNEIGVFSPDVVDSNGYRYYSVVSAHIKNCDKYGIRRPYSIGEIFTRESVENERFYNYKYFYTKLKQGENIKGAYKKQSGSYLIAYYSDGFESSINTYRSLISYANKNNLCIDEYFFEFS
jgi:effector-binding domain-containing protein